MSFIRRKLTVCVTNSLALCVDPIGTCPYHPNVQPVISAAQMREIDRLTTRDFQLSPNQLMKAAASKCFDVIASYFSPELPGKRALILCGPGNNGGDGAELGVGLHQAGVHTDIVLFGRVANLKGAALNAFETLLGEISRYAAAREETSEPSVSLTFKECESAETWDQLKLAAADYDVVVDALFGTGLSRPLEGIFLHAVQYFLAAREARETSGTGQPIIFSVDLPSGLDADSAKPIGAAVHADITVTFTAAKTANALPPASHLNGELVVVDIGSPASLVEATNPQLFLTEAEDARAWLASTRYTPDSFKQTHGHVLVIAGSRGYTGAAVLCGDAAMRSGAGLVTIATPASAQSSVAASVMSEVMTTALAETDRGAVSDEAVDHVMKLAEKAHVIAIGPGLSASDERTRRFVYAVVKQREVPMVIDADGLNCLASYSANGWPAELQGSDNAPLILTPHAGEMLRLLGTTDKTALDDRVTVVREFATKHKLILVLKGERSLIAAPDGRVFINPTGNAGLGTAGAGDTLTGLVAGFVAQDHATFATLKKDADAVAATIAALYVGGLAGDLAARDLGMRTMVASDIRDHFSEAICMLDPQGEQP
jgi:NAD(P)H-hydrate epimerase